MLKLVEGEEGNGEIALLDLGKDEELGQLVGMALYTTPDGQAQREDLNKHRGALMIARVSHEELLDAVERVMPTSVFVDGKQVAGSVFIRMLREDPAADLERLEEELLAVLTQARLWLDGLSGQICQKTEKA